MKTCVQCGEEFTKNPSMARKQWDRQRFCSKACGGAWRSAQRPECELADCHRPHKVHGFCSLHSQRLLRHGTPTGPPMPTVEQRFWALVAIGQPDECWEWSGSLNNQGYGRFHVSNTPFVHTFSHRFAYEMATGIDISEWEVRHHCDNPPCVNPAHLIHGTHADNMADTVERRRLDLSGLRPGTAAAVAARRARAQEEGSA